MTSTVKVITSDWPVEVTITDHLAEKQACTTEYVAPKSEREFHLTDTHSIGLRELSRPEVAAAESVSIGSAA